MPHTRTSPRIAHPSSSSSATRRVERNHSDRAGKPSSSSSKPRVAAARRSSDNDIAPSASSRAPSSVSIVAAAAAVDAVVSGSIPAAAAASFDLPAVAAPRRHHRKSPLIELRAAASSAESDSSPAPRKQASDENVLDASALATATAAASASSKSSSSSRRLSGSVLSELIATNAPDDFRSATTSGDGSVLMSNGSFVVTRSAKTADGSASPLPDSGASIAVDKDARLWYGDHKHVERIISFQRSSSGRHGISQTTSGHLIRHPIMLTGPSPTKDDDSGSSTVAAASTPPENARQHQLSFGSSLSSSDVESPKEARSRNSASRRRHRATLDSASKDVHDVLSAMGATSLQVPDSVIVDIVMSPTRIAALDGDALDDARSLEEQTEPERPATPPAVATSPPPPEKPQSPALPTSPKSPSLPTSPKSPAQRSSPPGGGGGGGGGSDAMTYVTVDDRRERIVSMRTSKSGRHTVTQTESGAVITQPVFFSPGGVVQTELVPIYEAEEATTIASIASSSRPANHHRRSARSTNVKP